MTKTKKQEESIIVKPEVMAWYAIKTQNNKERSVLEKLKQELRFEKLEEKIGKSIIPTEKILSIKNGKKVFKEKIIYPGYIFIETDSKGEIINLLKSINGAAGFVKTKSGEILPMKDYEVKKILIEQEITENKDFSNIYVMNEEVEIIDGAFSSFNGIISKLDPEKEKVQVQVSIFGRPTNVDLTLLQIKKI